MPCVTMALLTAVANQWGRRVERGWETRDFKEKALAWGGGVGGGGGGALRARYKAPLATVTMSGEGVGAGARQGRR